MVAKWFLSGYTTARYIHYSNRTEACHEAATAKMPVQMFLTWSKVKPSTSPQFPLIHEVSDSLSTHSLAKAWFKCPSLGFSITKIWLGFCGTGVTKDCECSLNNPAWKVPCPFQNTFNICKIDCYGVRLKSHAIMQRITGKLHKHSFLNWNLTSI